MKCKQMLSVLTAAFVYFSAAASSLPPNIYHFIAQEESLAGNSEVTDDISSPLIDAVTAVSGEYLSSVAGCCNGLLSLFTENSNEPAWKTINVQPVYQLPELPTGCEVTSLTIVLKYLGYDADKLTLARDYLPKLAFYRSGGELYGADFRTAFAGDPESIHAYGCYAPCIAETADLYLADNGSDFTAHDITGTELDTLLSDYISDDIPVIIWITNGGLHEPEPTDSWLTPDGEQVQWLSYEHCVVLTGYDIDHGLVFVADPLIGNTAYSYVILSQRYSELGKQAVYIQ